MEEIIDIPDLSSEIDLTDNLHNAISTSKCAVPQKESLYLIAKLLQSIQGFENTAEAFERDLVHILLLLFLKYLFTYSLHYYYR